MECKTPEENLMDEIHRGDVLRDELRGTIKVLRNERDNLRRWHETAKMEVQRLRSALDQIQAHAECIIERSNI